ncbi:MAG TPA: hypothetical protein DCX54_01055 [Flavobacteriales bacterium]|nr:hypothetical protein [Flavobacteriales bacterium]
MDNNVDGDTMADDYNKILRYLQNLKIPESAIEEAAMEVDSKVIMADENNVLNRTLVMSIVTVSFQLLKRKRSIIFWVARISMGYPC